MDDELETLLHIYARRRWLLVPVGTNKVPLLRGWPTRASSDPVVWREWLARWPRAALALATGPASGVAVVDVDVRGRAHASDGLGVLDDWQAELGYLPIELAASTPSGGLHLFFTRPHRLRRLASRTIAPGLDLRADGGLAVLPTGARTPGRSWITPPDAPVPHLPPAWLWRLAPPRERAPHARQPLPAPATDARLTRVLARLAAARPGERNNVLYWSAMRVLEASSPATRDAWLTAIRETARRTGLDPTEISRTIASAVKRATGR